MRGLFHLLLLALLAWPSILRAAPVVMFDEGHGQPFLARGERPLDLSALAGVFAAAGYEVRTSSQPLDARQLTGINVLVSSGAFRPFTPEEVSVVRAFLEQGGGLAVMLHVAPPYAGLLHALEVDFTNGTLREQSHVVGTNRQDFRVRDLSVHPLTAGLQDFAVYGAWALRGMVPEVSAVARTSAHGWVDLNRDGQLSVGDAVQPFAVAVAGTCGHGRFAVFGDDALFQNRFLEGSNRTLADNLARWLGLSKTL
ncbi:MAG: DUF4350 domain-containing protein [Desulfuromonadales bacterium]